VNAPGPETVAAGAAEAAGRLADIGMLVGALGFREDDGV
jgi:hypothetical protein